MAISIRSSVERNIVETVVYVSVLTSPVGKCMGFISLIVLLLILTHPSDDHHLTSLIDILSASPYTVRIGVPR